LELLGYLGCRIRTSAQSVLSVLKPEPGSVLVVFGAGAVGLSAVLAAMNLTGARVICVDVKPARLARASQMGATPVDATTVDPVEAILELTNGRGAGYSLETSGVPAVLG
jgi:aryl-alcohol dehydrogenase